jgi:hypothetical protein
VPIEQSPEVTISPVERIRGQFLTLSAPSVFLDNPLHSSAPAVIEAVSGAMVGAASDTWRIEPEDLRPLL